MTDDAALANHAMHNEDDPALGPSERAMVAFARKLTLHPDEMQPDDLDTLRAQELDDEHVLAVVLVVCLFNFMTRLAHALNVEVEPGKAKQTRAWLEQRDGPEWDFLRF